jgi:type VI secretion system protein VasD
LTGAVIASPHINPTSEGESRPVQLRLYQLKTDTSFINATFEQIWHDEKTILGESLAKVEEVTVYPNTRSPFAFERDESSQFLIAAALFREPRGRAWYYSFELPPPPSAGACGLKCVGDDCDAGAEKDPRIFIWIDGMVVQDGAEHAEDEPSEGDPTDTDRPPSSSNGVSCDKIKTGISSVPLSTAPSVPNSLPSAQPPKVLGKP